MPNEPEPRLDTPGLSGGPGPTPPDLDDGARGAEEPAPDEPGAAAQQRRAGELSERSAGSRQEPPGPGEGLVEKDMGEQQPDEG